MFSPENVQEASIKGLESRLSYSDPNDITHLNLDYTYLDAQDAVNNNQLIYRPKHQLKAELIVSIKQFRVKGGFRFLGKRFTNADNLSLLDSHSLVDIGAAWNQPFNVGNFKIKIAMRNIFDKQIKVIDGFPAPGRELRSSVGFTF
ncbi:TonB-dependent receptor [candidate division KSB1 bacterium]|nr:TonB-dependent receptor [candidate division KSB1 bacterium]